MKRTRFSRKGFTLVEIILATSIFAFLAGAIYFSVSTSVSAANDLGHEQIETRKGSAFVRFLRKGFANLPSEAEISLGARQIGARGDAVDFVIRRAPGAFATGALESLGGGVVLSTVPDGRGKSRFSITRFPDKLGESELSRHMENALWLPILENIETLRWRFWDAKLGQFVELWERPAEHPALIELTYQCAGEQSRTCLFHLPKLSRQVRAAPKEKPEKP